MNINDVSLKLLIIINNTNMITTKEINYKETNIHCSLCNHLAVQMPDGEEPTINPCDHLLFVGHDIGLEYQSDRFNEYLQKEYGTIGFDDPETFDSSFVDIKGSIRLVQYQPAPSFYGTYFGFAPVD